MSIKDKVKSKAKARIRKLAFKIIKPFLPFVMVIVGIIFAVCTVADNYLAKITKNNMRNG